MTRPIVFDLTHLQHRIAYEAPSGIDRVDLLFARHFSYDSTTIAAAAHYGQKHVKLHSPDRLRCLTAKVEERWRETTAIGNDERFARTSAWLRGLPVPEPAAADAHGLRWTFATKLLPFFRYMQLGRLDRENVPEGAIYLNIAQHSAENPNFFDWLRRRKDVKAVFFLHDLIPLDYPEFWWDGHEDLFRRRVEVILEHASALITSSASVRDRVHLELERRGKPRIPILSCALPSALETVAPAPSGLALELASVPYFVALGTIEPRKNHLLLLNIWRRLATEQREAVPKLVIIGKRGWENDHTIGMLERCPALRGHVWEIGGVSAAGVSTLLANARGLLMPSFAEGYGLPMVEALSLGTPVLVSDLPVFREVAQNKALFCDPVDGLGWAAHIRALSDPYSATARNTRTLAASFVPPKVADYFARIEDFLASL